MPENTKIISRDNRRLVNARKVRDGKSKTEIFVEGRRLVIEALRSEIVINECFVSDDFGDLNLLCEVRAAGGNVFEIPVKVLSSIADTEQSQGIVLLGDRPRTGRATVEDALDSASVPLVVFLKEVNNPSNLGAILRTAEAAGVAGVIVSKRSADPFAAKALRSAMGSGFRIPVWDNATFEEVLEWSTGMRLVATAADISAEISYTEIDWRVPRLLIFGSEAHGFSDEELEMIQQKLIIPMQNGVESLNLAVSAAVLMFEAQRQRLTK